MYSKKWWKIISLALLAGCSADSMEGSGGAGGSGGQGGLGGESAALVDENVGNEIGVDDRWTGEQNSLAVAPPANATACTANNQCSTGYCVDGFCCDSKCDNKCMACSAAKKGSGADGICGSIAYDTDPDNDCPVGACDGKNMCKNYNGVACTAAPQCLSNYCVDGYCCGNICMGACQACSAVKKGSGYNGVCGAIAANTDPDNECNPGECNGAACSSAQTPAANGAACTSAAQCASGYCADGVCCDSWCLGTCQACSAAKKGSGINGVCGNIANDQDPDEECWGGSCDGKGSCKQYNGVPCTAKSQCLSGYCVDGVCCGNICNLQCQACSEARKGQGYDGVCGPIASGKDPDNECNPGECGGAGTCNQQQTPQPNGTVCVTGAQCASNYCVDGLCCDTACAGSCQACTAAKKGSGADGTCGNIGYDRDPDDECYGGGCSGTGSCKYYNGLPCAAGGDCLSNYCVDGFCCNNVCTGACAACSTAKKGSGFNGVCGLIAANTDPDNECTNGECTGSGSCNSPQQPAPNGTVCASAAQCASGFCVDGVCCSNSCNDPCLACTAAKKGQGADGTCGPIITGTDPDNECVNSECNGAGVCIAPTNLPNGTSCTASSECASTFCVDGVCCDSACSGSCQACTATKKGQGTNGTCGVIKYDTDPDEECYAGACNGGGACQYYNSAPCGQDAQCLSGYCVDGFCCNNHCGGQCYACSAAKKGSGTDGICSPISATLDPDGECPATYCSGSASGCAINSCTSQLDCPSTASCINNQCVCNAGYSGGGLTCADINECLTNNGGCNADATCMNMPGSRLCECNPGFTGDGFTCTDIDECQTNNGGCNVNATCTNTQGSRTCTCNMGYTGDGINCTFDGSIASVRSQSFYSCARGVNNTLKCWGWNSHGTLGLGDTYNRGDNPGEMGTSLPIVSLGTGRSVIGFAVGYYHACALLNGGDVKCWGNSSDAKLGIGFTYGRGDNPGEMGDNLPIVNLGTGKTAVQVALGSVHSCALLQDGSVKCWGSNVQGALGSSLASAGASLAEMGDNLPAVNLGTGKTAVFISAGVNITCAILNDGSLKCWGDNTYGRLGQGHTTLIGNDSAAMGDNLLPIALGTGKTAVKVATDWNHVCAILNDGSVKCWGENTGGQLGVGDKSHRGDNAGEMGDNLPSVALGTGKTAIDIAVGSGHTCALLNDGNVKCWGTDNYGSLGRETSIAIGDQPGEMGDFLTPINLGTGRTAVAITTGQFSPCAILDNAKLKCWGYNGYGQLGLGDSQSRGQYSFSMGDNLPFVSVY